MMLPSAFDLAYFSTYTSLDWVSGRVEAMVVGEPDVTGG